MPPIKFFGIFGVYTVNQNTYVILIKSASAVGEILKAPIFRVESLQFLPLFSNSNDVQAADKQYIDMILNLQKPRSFFFSYKLDLTKRIQVVIDELK